MLANLSPLVMLQGPWVALASEVGAYQACGDDVRDAF